MPAVLLLALVTAARLAELGFARRNTKSLIAKGAYEVAPGHYALIVTLHLLWLASLWVLGSAQNIDMKWFAFFFAFQALRVWTLATLGRRWTTRIIVLPNAPLVANGPYRFLNHPNYVVVIGEIATLPLCLGLPGIAVAFSVANALLLSVRIRAENAALSEVRRVAHA